MNAAARSGSGYLIAALSVAGITLVGHRWLHLNPTTIALAFLLGVLGISASWGLRQAVFMSVMRCFQCSGSASYAARMLQIEVPPPLSGRATG